MRSPLATSVWSGAPSGPHAPPGQVAFLLIYPDTYEIGLPNQGLQILYEILNERTTRLAERAYAPWTDMDAPCGATALPLFSVDTHRPRRDFDVLAFNLSAELVYTNLLDCVDLAGVPVRNDDRRPEDPIVIAGGHCAYNPEPLAEYVDAFVMGDGEEVDRRGRRGRRRVEARRCATRDRAKRVLRELATIEGVYVPAMYDVDYDGPCIREVTSALRRRARASSTSARSPISPTGRTRSSSSCRSSRSCTTG